MKVLVRILVLTLLAITVSGHGNHDHAHWSCACEAQELGFNIDCSQSNLMLNALSSLQANNCDVNCSYDICNKNFLIIQSHHVFCLQDEVPNLVEDAFHAFEEPATAAKSPK